MELELGRSRQALATLQRARRVYVAERMAAALRNCDRNIANCYRLAGSYAAALRTYARLRADFLAQGMVIDAANCDMNMALVSKEQGHFSAARRCFQMAADACVAAGLPLHAARCRANMALASFKAGVAFTSAGVGYVHAIAHNFGAYYHVPHGLANAIVMPYVLDYSKPECTARLAKLAEVSGLKQGGETEAQLADAFIAKIRAMNAEFGIPTTVEKLKASQVPYQLSSGGTTISVPAEQVTELRLQMASSGTLSAGHVGFDIFDKTSFGATDFTQQVNYQRALEGELARTLEGMKEVKSARVHITRSRESVFADKTEPAKASVICVPMFAS